MKKTLFCLILFLSLASGKLFSQNRPFINEIIKLIGTNAKYFFLAANRPSYGTSPYLAPEGNLELATGINANKDIYEIPVDFSYGLSDKVELMAGFTAYSYSYNFLGDRIKGFGDSFIGVKYLFHESKYFDHVMGFNIKIPTASKSKEVGTGKVDFHFGLAQGFYYKKFSYELEFDLNLLGRRDLPATNKRIPPNLKTQLDSLINSFNYKYEPEICFSFSPLFELSDYLSIYAGYLFTRNTRLDFNYNSVFGGFGIAAGNYVSFSLGGTYGLETNSGWMAELGMNIVLSHRKY
jgi:hypothetical protein